jgi:penicillin-binding protein activator
MNKIKQLLVINLLVVLLGGCHLISNTEKAEVSSSVDVIQPTESVVEQPPQFTKKVDWYAILSPYVQQLLQSSPVYEGNNVILISDIQNRSGDYLANNQVDDTLHQLMDKQNTFIVADKKSIILAKQTLGISSDDKLVSRSKMIGLAKSMNAGYVLFTTIYKTPSDENNADLSMELLATQSGEILKRITSKDFLQTQDENPNQSVEFEENN